MNVLFGAFVAIVVTLLEVTISRLRGSNLQVPALLGRESGDHAVPLYVHTCIPRATRDSPARPLDKGARSNRVDRCRFVARSVSDSENVRIPEGVRQIHRQTHRQLIFAWKRQTARDAEGFKGTDIREWSLPTIAFQ